MIETPYDLDAIRRLDNARLWQFCVLLEDFGWPVASAWLAMCLQWGRDGYAVETRAEPSQDGWQHDTNQGSNNRSAASGSDPTDGTCNVVTGQGQRSRNLAAPSSQTPWPRSRRAVH